MGGLAGRRILITRAAGDLAALAALVRARGAEPIPFPCIAFAQPEAAQLEELDRALARLPRDPPAAVALASPHAVEHFVERLRALGFEPAQALANVLAFAAGEGTARALAAHGIAALVPEEGSGAAALARKLLDELTRLNPDNAWDTNDNGLHPKQSRRVLLPQAAESTPALAESLRAAGFETEVVVLYRTEPETRISELHAEGIEALRAHSADAVAFASGSAVRGFIGLLGLLGLVGAEASALVAPLRVACMGESCAAVARSLGLEVSAVGARGFDSMLDALASCYAAPDVAKGRFPEETG